MAAGPVQERNQDATIYVGGIDEKVNEALIWELFQQAGPVVNVHLPKDRITQVHQGYGFVEFLGEEDADYAIKIMNMIKLYGKPVKVNKASAHQKQLDVGANIFIGNLDPEVDEKLLYDTFSAFGIILQSPKIMRDPDSGNSKGFAFINFANFEASDAAVEAMNGQFLCNRPITISYAFKKDSKGERHGTAAERLLAAQNPLSHAERPHQLFADRPFMMLPPPPPPPSVLAAAAGMPLIPPMVMKPHPTLPPNMLGYLPPPPPMFLRPPPGGPPFGMMPPAPPNMMFPMPGAAPNSALLMPPPPPPPSHLNLGAPPFVGNTIDTTVGDQEPSNLPVTDMTGMSANQDINSDEQSGQFNDSSITLQHDQAIPVAPGQFVTPPPPPPSANGLPPVSHLQ